MSVTARADRKHAHKLIGAAEVELGLAAGVRQSGRDSSTRKDPWSNQCWSRAEGGELHGRER